METQFYDALQDKQFFDLLRIAIVLFIFYIVSKI